MTKQKLKKIILVLLFVLFLFNSAHSETFDVSSVAQIQSALDAAAHNGQDDEINIAAGTHHVTDTLTYVQGETFSLTIQGAGMDKTILDGGGAVRVMVVDTAQVAMDYGTIVTVKGVCIQNGDSQSGGAGLRIIARDAHAIIENTAFISNQSSPPLDENHGYQWDDGGGGGLFIGGPNQRVAGDATVESCLFKNNRSTNGAGAYIWAFDGLIAHVRVLNNIFDGNQASADGGGLWVRADYLWAVNNTAVGNTSEANGGGITFFYSRNDIYNNIAWGNSAQGQGGDIYIYDGSKNDLYNNTYADLVFETGDTYSEEQTSNDNPLVETDYSLNEQSPCRNSGDSNAPELPEADFRSNNRISGAAVDRGAIEYGSTPATEPTDDPGESNGNPDGVTPSVGGSGGSGCFIGVVAASSTQGVEIDPNSRAYKAAKRIAEKHNSAKAQQAIKKQTERLQPLVAKQKTDIYQYVCAENRPPQTDGKCELLVFISGSMPTGVIKSFVGETSKLDCNAKYILAGHPEEGVDPFSQAITEAHHSLDLHIDPLMFDAYAVKQVPALIVNRQIKINHPESIKSALEKIQNATGEDFLSLINHLSYGE